MTLKDLQDGMTVRCRTSRTTNLDIGEPMWSEWEEKTLRIERRKTPLPAVWKKQAKGFSEVGDIVWLAISDDTWAVYTQGDYNPEFREFLVEDYRLQVEGLE